MKYYLMKHKRVSLSDLSLRFDKDPDAIKGMMGQWIRKGKVVKSTIDTDCCTKGCTGGCDMAVMEIYEWNY